MKLLYLFSLMIFIGIFLWKSQDVNWAGEKNALLCIKDDPSKQDLILESMDSKFKVSFVENSLNLCVNPHFPSIYITTESGHNAWFQIINTDSYGNAPKFIDTIAKSDYFPFYSFEKDFGDTPIWSYGLIIKPLSFWNAHAYAVFVDKEKKTLQVSGGIEWGYRLSHFKLRPMMIKPRPLSKQEWKDDWQFLKSSISEYEVIE